MVPYMTFWQRVLAWLLMKIEAKHGWGVGFDPKDIEGANFLLLNSDNAGWSYTYCLMRDYHYVKCARKYDKEVG